ncbi:MAG: prolipoprotein diacylglyceryl transferase [Oscillospiraceae bacterium]|nr:prolipoprotein diacylglyceryl transferase [Oscillospiraceae bacterium]
MFPILTVFETIRRDSAISFPMLGNFSIDPPSYFTVFGRNIYFYGVLIALGVLLAILYCGRKSAAFGIRADDFYDLMLWLIPLSIVGARLYFVLFRLEDYRSDPLSILYVHEGGLAIYGGVIAGVLCVVGVCRHKKIPIPAMLDLAILGLLIGQIVGRWGNFMNREAFGAETTIFCRMGLTAPDGTTIYVHPTFLYESLWNLIGFLFLLLFVKTGRRRYDGQCALIYFFWYGLGRFWIEGLRTDSLYIGGSGIRVSQLLSLILALTAGTILLLQSRKPHPPEKLYVNQVSHSNKEEENDG